MPSSRLKKTGIATLVLLGVLALPMVAQAVPPEASMTPGNHGDVLVPSGHTDPLEGGFYKDGTAVTGNSVTLNDTSINIVGAVRGGGSWGGATGSVVSGNVINFSDGRVNGSVIGGFSRGTLSPGIALSNKVNISGNATSSGGADIYGGFSDGDVLNNEVNINISGAFKFLNIYGGKIEDPSTGLISGNKVNITSTGDLTEFLQPIYGGRNILHSTNSGDVSNNVVTLNGKFSTKGFVFGGTSAGSGHVMGNIVNIIDTKVGNTIFGGDSTGSGHVMGNVVNLSGEFTIPKGALGGFVDQPGSGDALGNIVNINGHNVLSTISDAVGGRNMGSGNAIGNTVNITGGNFTSSLQTPPETVTGGKSRYGAATGNTVNITGGFFNGDITGGYVERGSGPATGNKVIISNASGNGVGFTNSSNIRGGFNFSGSGNVITGNTLYTHLTGLTVNSISNFETYNFYVPIDYVFGTAFYSTSTTVDLDNTTVNVIVDGKAAPLVAGDVILPFNNSSFTNISNVAVNLYHNSLLQYGFNFSPAGIQIAGAQAATFTKTYGQARLGSLTAVSIGASMVSEEGFSAANNALLYANKQGSPALFTALGGGISKFDTSGDSSIRLKHMSFMTGLGWRADADSGSAIFGAFLEGGVGSYDGKMDGRKYADGDKVTYIGGGLMGRYELDSGFYVEGSAHAGSTEAKYEATPIFSPVNFKSRSAYYGAHAGLGQKINFSETSNLDLSGKFFWTSMNKDDVKIDDNNLDFDHVNSYRLQLSGRQTFSSESGIAPYLGAALEYEFGGKAKGRALGYNINEAKISGATGIGEIGVKFADSSGLSIEIGAQGYVGQRDGVAGVARLSWTF